MSDDALRQLLDRVHAQNVSATAEDEPASGRHAPSDGVPAAAPPAPADPDPNADAQAESGAQASDSTSQGDRGTDRRERRASGDRSRRRSTRARAPEASTGEVSFADPDTFFKGMREFGGRRPTGAAREPSTAQESQSASTAERSNDRNASDETSSWGDWLKSPTALTGMAIAAVVVGKVAINWLTERHAGDGPDVDDATAETEPAAAESPSEDAEPAPRGPRRVDVGGGEVVEVPGRGQYRVI